MADSYEKISDQEFYEISTDPRRIRLGVDTLKSHRRFLVNEMQKMQALIAKIDLRLQNAAIIGVDTSEKIIASSVVESV